MTNHGATIHTTPPMNSINTGKPDTSSLEECYLSWNDDSVVLVCERPECMIPRPMSAVLDGATPHHRPYTEDLPYRVLPETAVLIRARHLATHRDES